VTARARLVIGHHQGQGADSGMHCPRLVAVAMTGPGLGSLVGFGTKMGCHLGFQHLLEGALVGARTMGRGHLYPYGYRMSS